MLEEVICHFRGVGSIWSLLFYILWKILLANNVDPDQMPHYVTSDLGLHCLPSTLFWVSKAGLEERVWSPSFINFFRDNSQLTRLPHPGVYLGNHRSCFP